MIMVIDGYNVLKQLVKGKYISESQRIEFIHQVSSYIRVKGHKAVVVFDGGPCEWPEKQSIAGVDVVYSGSYQTADDYIRHYLKKYALKDLLLVSSDLELNRKSDALSIPSIDSHYFYQLMVEGLGSAGAHAPNEPVIKLRQEANKEVDELMIEASKKVVVKSEDVVLQKNRQPSGKKMSRSDRMLRKKLKKL